jgi:hypothetical protein
MIQATLVGMSMIFHCTKLNFSKCNSQRRGTVVNTVHYFSCLALQIYYVTCTGVLLIIYLLLLTDDSPLSIILY